MEKKKMNGRKKLLIAISAVLVLSLVIVTAVANILYVLALEPGGIMRFIDGRKVIETDAGQDANIEKNPFFQSGSGDWLNEKAEDCSLTSEDGLKLHAYSITNDNGMHKYAVICHGYSSQAAHMAAFAMKFYDMGFSCLLPDARGHGASEGDYIGMGWDERIDTADWIEYIVEKDPLAEIMMFGVSMGGATVMMTSGEELPDNVKLFIEDCGYSSVWDEFESQLNGMFHLPTFPFLHAAELVCKLRAGYGFKEASAVEQVKKCTEPMLFIHGDKDTFVPYKMLDKVYDAATCEKEKLIVPGAAHAMSSSVDGELYWKTVTEFIEKYM